jgi:hypothetical protein
VFNRDSLAIGASNTLRRRSLLLVVFLALMTSLSLRAKADPVMGTIELTVAPNVPRLGNTVYLSGSVDLSNLPQNLPLPGPSLGYNNDGQFNENINTTFDLKVTFGGASGSQPYVDLTGPLVGSIGGTSAVENMGGQFTASPTSAVLHNWSASSGVPLALIEPYLNPASYHLDGAIEGGAMNMAGFLMTVDPSTASPPVSAPEPVTMLMYLAVISGLGMRHGVRARRACSAC